MCIRDRCKEAFQLALKLKDENAEFARLSQDRTFENLFSMPNRLPVSYTHLIPLAAHQVMITLSQLFYLVLSGMAAALAIRVSHFKMCIRDSFCVSAHQPWWEPPIF